MILDLCTHLMFLDRRSMSNSFIFCCVRVFNSHKLEITVPANLLCSWSYNKEQIVDVPNM